MLNYIWGGMIIIGILIGTLTGNIPKLTTAVIDSSKEAVTTCITMLGILSMWTGIMNIAQKSGLIHNMTKKMKPFLCYLFPEIPKNHKAMDYIATNVIANFLGLGWASTPAGLKAMEQMQLLNKSKTIASRSMCMFMIFNMSSLQLLSVNLIAYRSQFNSQNPSEIIGAGIFTTLISTITAVIFAKIMEAIHK